jgi:hypothetical protein
MELLFENGKLTEKALRLYVEKKLSEFTRKRVERFLLKHPEWFDRLDQIKSELSVELPEKHAKAVKKAT